jgi:hypothetical protein
VAEAPVETRWLIELVRRAREEGRYTLEQIDDFYVGVLFSIGADLTRLPPQLAKLMIAFMIRAEIVPGASAEETRAAIDRYFEAHPIAPELAVRFRLHMREMMRQPEHEADVKRYAHFLDEETDLRSRNEPPPKGAVGGGPLAFFKAHAKLKPSR